MISQVARRYADSLFGLAKRRGALEHVARDVRRIATALADPRAQALVTSRRVDGAKRRASLEPLLESAHALTRNFVSLCFDKRREAVLLELGDAFHERELEEAGAVEGVVESARALGDAEVDRLASHLGARIGKSVRLTNRVVPELVGGVRVIVGSHMLDNSVKGRLEGLRQRLMEVPVGA
ncbi:MAG: ATP synthase F1 subunit delta [Planctomycetota bacterium]